MQQISDNDGLAFEFCSVQMEEFNEELNNSFNQDPIEHFNQEPYQDANDNDIANEPMQTKVTNNQVLIP